MTRSGSDTARAFSVQQDSKATRWTVVLAAGKEDSPSGREALAEICRLYWQPLYVYVRQCGYGVQDAEDLTQAFFSRLVEKKYVAQADRAKGRFRSFLLTALQHFLSDKRDKAKAQKRGGGRSHLPLNTEILEGKATPGLTDNLSPDKLFDQRWAITLLERVLKRVADEYRAANKQAQFEMLQDYLAVESRRRSYAEAARRLGMTDGAVRVAVHRLRQRYRGILREAVASTVADPRQVDAELRELFAAFNP